jgi:hypothetical protein
MRKIFIILRRYVHSVSFILSIYIILSRLGGVIVTVLTIGPKISSSNPVEAMDFQGR